VSGLPEAADVELARWAAASLSAPLSDSIRGQG
jgi:hypothetical protein